MKRKLSIITSLVLIVAISITIVACSKNPSGESNYESTNSTNVQDIVTNEQGETVDKNADGENVTSTGDKTTDKADNKTEQASTTKKKQKKPTQTTESTTHYTTTAKQAPLNPFEGVEEPADDSVFTESSAMAYLQIYYGDDYVVNYDSDKTRGTVCYYSVFKKENKYKVYATVKVDLYSGKVIQTLTKNNKSKEIKII